MSHYFANFPVINYSNVAVTDITKRARITNKAFNNPNLFYPYEVKNGLRADVLSYTYYDDSYYDWIVYFANQIQDPYYDWTLSESDFNDFITKKYGSQEYAMQHIRHYQLDWASSDYNISPGAYESLPEELKKYYNPNFGYNTKIISYKRRREDWVVNTNKIIELSISYACTSPIFIIGEQIHIQSNLDNIGAGEIVASNNTMIMIQHISGNTSSNNNVIGLTSNASANVTQSIKLVENLTANEEAFWSPVSYYDYERDKNESKKFVQVIDANYALEIEEEFRKMMKST